MKVKPVIGQEAVCPDGLGRVTSIQGKYIKVDTYVDNRGWYWHRDNVRLVRIRYEDDYPAKKEGALDAY